MVLKGGVVRSEAIDDNSPGSEVNLRWLDTTERLSDPNGVQFHEACLHEMARDY